MNYFYHFFFLRTYIKLIDAFQNYSKTQIKKQYISYLSLSTLKSMIYIINYLCIRFGTALMHYEKDFLYIQTNSTFHMLLLIKNALNLIQI